MEQKKSYKADLEHRRPMIFAVALVATTLLFVAVLFVPFKSLSEWGEEFFDDYSMDLELKANDQDDMIAAAKKEELQPQEAEKLNKVDETAELAPEILDQTAEDSEETKEEEAEEEEPMVNLNDDSEETLRIVEQLPEYPGGMSEFVKWLTATLKYPDAALRQRIQGKVMISFIVNKDGSLSDVKIMKGAHKLLDAEAMRVALLMPKWQPGKENGVPCKTMVAIPIVFEI